MSHVPLNPQGWLPSAAAIAAGRVARIRYEDGPAMSTSNCSGGLRAGTRAMGAELRRRYPFVHQVGGYSCRPNTANRSALSLHGTGRAMDLMVRAADTQSGNALADWLVVHAEELGVQLVIWNRNVWSSARVDALRFYGYGGPSAHTDHLHVELIAASADGGSVFARGGFRTNQERGVAPATRAPTRAPGAGSDTTRKVATVLLVATVMGTALAVAWPTRR